MIYSARQLLHPNVRRKLGALRDRIISRWFAALAVGRLRQPTTACPHALPGELIASLTSYPARFRTLRRTLACLLDQTVKADRTILWIAQEHLNQLPTEVRRLETRGLEIRACDDLRSYKKLIPALEAFPNAFIATADDDAYYPRNWLEELVNGIDTPRVITCHRAHRLKQTGNCNVAPYLEWDFDVQDEASRRPSADLLPTGVGGILYPPHSLDPRIVNRALFERLAPFGDDLWFYWCARMAGTLHKKVGGRMSLVVWSGSQQTALWSGNEAGGNDRMIAALEREFGAVPVEQSNRAVANRSIVE
ncbi:glycosyltransferase family 2 protein [Sphingomonas segetis]|jgi:hypothetical protein|uniref:glycosyltransferase family 2 protein n=1 Tax=Sphingomonas segetis TaxID=1104779 RepID=UPI0012D3177B|nr:glycosyltransferase family 2 protein [Sphingomonas segetis]